MGVRAQSLILMVVGAVIFAVCLLADMIGIGADQTIIGWKQYSGAVVGLMLVFFGAHVAFHHIIQK
jgi:hypothetical protein